MHFTMKIMQSIFQRKVNRCSNCNKALHRIGVAIAAPNGKLYCCVPCALKEQNKDPFDTHEWTVLLEEVSTFDIGIRRKNKNENFYTRIKRRKQRNKRFHI